MRRLISLALLLLCTPALAQTNLVGTGVRIVPQADAPPSFTLGRVGLWSPDSGGDANKPLWRNADGSDTDLSGGGGCATLAACFAAAASASDNTLLATSTTGGLRVWDNATPIAAALLEIESASGTTTYFSVTPTTVTIPTYTTTTTSYGTALRGNVSSSSTTYLLERVTPAEAGTEPWGEGFYSATNVASARNNNIYAFGWNVGAGGNPITSAKAQIGMSIESYYKPGGTELAEMHLFTNSDGAVPVGRRPISILMDRATGFTYLYSDADEGVLGEANNTLAGFSWNSSIAAMFSPSGLNQFRAFDGYLDAKYNGSSVLGIADRLFPITAAAFDLGDADHEFRNAYLSGEIRFGASQDAGLQRSAAAQIQPTDGAGNEGSVRASSYYVDNNILGAGGLIFPIYSFRVGATTAMGLSKGAALASATTIAPTSLIHHVTGTTDVATITAAPEFTAANYGGMQALVADSGFNFVTGGNIGAGQSVGAGKAAIMIYDHATTTWYPLTYLSTAGGTMTGAITLSGTQLGTYSLGGTPTLAASLAVGTDNTYALGGTTTRLTKVAAIEIDSGASVMRLGDGTRGLDLTFSASGQIIKSSALYIRMRDASNNGTYCNSAFGGCAIEVGGTQEYTFDTNNFYPNNDLGNALGKAGNGWSATYSRHFNGDGSGPTVAAGAAACTTPTIVSPLTGTDAAGKLDVTTGTSCAGSGVVATITFSGTYDSAPYVVLTPANAAAAALSGNAQVYVSSTTTTTAVISVGSTALTDATQYLWHFQVIQ